MFSVENETEKTHSLDLVQKIFAQNSTQQNVEISVISAKNNSVTIGQKSNTANSDHLIKHVNSEEYPARNTVLDGNPSIHVFEKNEKGLILTTSNNNTENFFKNAKKIQISSQISQPIVSNCLFEEPLDLEEKNIIVSKKHIKTGGSHFQKKMTMKIKSKKSIPRKISTPSSGFLLGVLKTVRKFLENLRFQIIYNDYKNLDHRHFELINDKTYATAYKVPKTFNSHNTKEPIYEIEKKVFSKLNCSFFWQKTNEIFHRSYKIYDRLAPVINPDHKSVIIWDFFLIIYLIFLMIMIPLHTCFNQMIEESLSENGYYFPLMNDSATIFLFIDIIFRFHVGYYHKGAKILERNKIIRSYLGEKFFCDMIAMLPFFFISSGLSEEDNYIKLLFFFKVFRIREILYFFETKLSLNDFYEGIFNLIKVVCKIIYIAHIIACLFHSIGSLMIDLNERSWLNVIDKTYLNDWKVRYIYCIYWAVTTLITVGYGDVTPQNPYEILFTIFVILIGCGTFAYGINSVGSILTIMKKREKEFKIEVKILNNFMQRNNLNSELQTRLREYFLYIRNEENSEDHEKEQAILKKLSSTLQNEVILHTTGLALKSMKMLSFNFSEFFLQRLVLKMKQKRLVPEEILFEEESQEDSIYFIMKGQVELFINASKLCILSQGQSFNEIPFLTNGLTGYGAKSTGYTSVFYIINKDFLELLKEFPQDSEKFCEIRDKIMLYKQIEDLHLECGLCGKKTHFIRNCPFINSHVDPWKTLKQHKNSYKYVEIERKEFQRRKPNAFFRNAKKIFSENLKIQSRKKLTSQSFSQIEEYDYNTLDQHSNPDSHESLGQIHNVNSINIDNSVENIRSKEFLLNSSLPIPKHPTSKNNYVKEINEENNLLGGMKIENNANLFSRGFHEDKNLMGFILQEDQKDIKEETNPVQTYQTYEEKENKKNFLFDLFRQNMDHHKNFEHYFPMNNCDYVIKKINKRGECKKEVMQTINNTFTPHWEKKKTTKSSKHMLSPYNAGGSFKKNLRTSFFKMESFMNNFGTVSPALKKKNAN